MHRTAIEKNRTYFNFVAFAYDLCFGNRSYGNPAGVLQDIQINPGSRVLDVGCGTGNLLKALESNHPDLDLHGVDIAENMLDVARKKLSRSRLTLQQDEKLEYPDGHFDYVFCTDSMHHYSDEHLSMKNLYRVLREGGKIVVLELDFGRFFNSIFHAIEPGHRRVYPPQDVRKLLERTGFKDIRTTRIGIASHTTVAKK